MSKLSSSRLRQFGLAALLLLAAGSLFALYRPAQKDASALESAAQEKDWTIHVTVEDTDYKPAKWEPESGVYLGAYVLQDRTIHASMETFNELTGRKHASFFKYVGYGEPFPADWVREVVAAGAFPHIAWEPNEGLDKVRDDAYMREFADAAAESGVPVFLRYASEMNGSWTNYSGDPDRYIRSWRLVHDVFERRAPNVAMVWTVLNVPEAPIDDYYPGDEYVDWVGVNIYNVKYHDGNPRLKADGEDPLDMLDYVYNRYSRRKPIQLSEYGATHYNTTDGVRDNGFAISKISRLYDNLEELYPRVKAVYYFDVNNLTEYNERRKINDYSITQEADLREAYRQAVSSPYFLSEYEEFAVASSAAEKRAGQRFTYRGSVFSKNGVLYADESFFTSLLGLELRQEDESGTVALSGGGLTRPVRAKSVPWRKPSGYTDWIGRPLHREGRALPLEQTVRRLGYKVNLNGTDIVIEE